jgi:hypothetical protein
VTDGKNSSGQPVALTCRVEEAGAVLGLGRTRAWASARDGTLPVVRFGRSVRVSVPALAERLGCETEELLAALGGKR